MQSRSIDLRALLTAIALVLGVAELIDAFFIDFPAAAVVVGVLFLLARTWSGAAASRE